MDCNRFVFLFCAIGAGACAVEPTDALEDVDDTSSAILGGMIDNSFPAIGRVTTDTTTCTGVLISPNHVLTAKHCAGANMRFDTGSTFSVSFGVDLQIPHPSRDQLIAQLARPITTIQPMPINEGPRPAIGAICTAVGRGLHDEPDGTFSKDVMRSALVRVTVSDPSPIRVVWVTGLPHDGDSGGPLLCDNEIAGVYSSRSGGSRDYSTVDVAWIKSKVTRALGSFELATVPGATVLAAYDAPGDGFQHVIAGTAAGALTETWFTGRGTSIGHGPLPSFASQVALAGYFSPDDGFQHVISAGSDGAIAELYWKPGSGVLGQGLLATVPGAVTVAGYHEPTGYQHVIVVTSTGEVREIYWKVGSGLPVGSGPLPTVSPGPPSGFRGIVGVAAYHSPTDGRQHVIVSNRAGGLFETVFGGGQEIAQRPLVTVGEHVALAAYHSRLDGRQHVIVAGAEGTLHEYRYTRYGDPVEHHVIAHLPGTKRVAAYSARDGFDHVIALLGDGRVIELVTKP